MRHSGSLLVLVLGLSLGALAALIYSAQPRTVDAASNDRFQDFIMATGAVSLSPRIQTDGVWLLDYRSGKLLGTVIDKDQGKIIGWAEVDLVAEFNVQPKQDVHFLMTTGYITQTQSALYLAETSTGKFGVYTMGPGPNGTGIVIRRHDISSFRKAAPAAEAFPEAPNPVAPPEAAIPMLPPATGNVIPPVIPNTPPTFPPTTGLPSLPDISKD